MIDKTFKGHLQEFALKKAIAYLEKDPDTNMIELLNWADMFDKENTFQSQIQSIREVLDDPSNNWYQLIKSLWTDIDNEVRKTLFENFIINAGILGCAHQDKLRKELDINVPWAILMDPTSACNLNCIGCWAAEYGNKLNMDYATLDSIIHQGKKMGAYMYIYTGGEPLVRKKDIIKLCEAHPDAVFLSFTNATLIDEEFANEMLRVKNFIPAISVEGFEEATDSRRGNGTYKAVCGAMKILKNKKLPFGISCCYTSQNIDVIGSEEYFDDMIAKGAKFAWFFTYMPIGKHAVPELMTKAEQREYMYHQIRRFRKTKPLFTIDFWNDSEYIDGCIAGGRRYLHINANGDIEPCVFIHYSDSNVYEKTLMEAYKSPLFMAYHKNQPFNSNHLRPCPLLDNPGALSKMVDESGAKSTDLESPENVHGLSEKCRKAAEKWKPVADRLWEKSQLCSCSDCHSCSKSNI
ncbi:MAG: radical SAM protein [Clostridiaceae bacterium]|nr:radical SAM protein [Clostridiaceae bacterium]